MSTAQCPDCGADNEDSVVRCANCGYLLSHRHDVQDIPPPVIPVEQQADAFEPPALVPVEEVGWEPSPLPCPGCGGKAIGKETGPGRAILRCPSCGIDYVGVSCVLVSKSSHSLVRASSSNPGVRKYELRVKQDDGAERIYSFDYYCGNEVLIKNGDRLLIVFRGQLIFGLINQTTQASYKAGPPPRPVATASGCNNPANMFRLMISACAVIFVTGAFFSCMSAFSARKIQDDGHVNVDDGGPPIFASITVGNDGDAYPYQELGTSSAKSWDRYCSMMTQRPDLFKSMVESGTVTMIPDASQVQLLYWYPDDTMAEVEYQGNHLWVPRVSVHRE